MLKVYYGDMPEAVFSTGVYFDNTYTDAWMTDPLTREIIRDIDQSDILADPSAYIESSQYFSWERYFTALLIKKTRGTWLAYSKRKLNPVYTQIHEVKEILKHTPLAPILDGKE